MRVVLGLLLSLTVITLCKGNLFGKCHVSYYTKDQISECYADCSDRNLTEIPNNLPTNTTCLNLAGNKISQLNGKVWQRYTLLERLSLARNRIESLRSGNFKGLTKLKMLDLSLNQIRYTKIDDNSFRQLKALTFLDIKQNLPNIWINERYPVTLKHLRSLRTLVIDGLGIQKLPNMPNLVELYMSGEYGRCNIPNINGSEFENILGVQNLFMSNCSIKNIEYNSFKPLKNIISLDLSWNINLGMESLPNITSGLKGRKTLKRLNFNTLYDHTKFDFCSSININDIRYLLNTSIELLTIENNNIVRMDTASVLQWPKSIKYLSVQHNMFLYGDYTPLIILSGMLNNIVYLDISRMSASNRPVLTSGKDIPVDEQPLQPNTQKNCQSAVTASSCFPSCLAMFTRYQVLDYFHVIERRLKKHNIGTYNKCIERQEMHAQGSKLEYLDLSENLPVLIERVFEVFPSIPNLKVLNVSRNYLGYPLYDGTSIIGQLKNIRTLDLSDNKIIHLIPEIFNNLTKLENLHLSHNKISNITFDLRHLERLRYLDLEDNSLESISLAARNAFDKLSSIRINIAKNNLKCICENMEVLLWIKKNKNKLAKLEATRCTFKNATSTSLATLNFEQLRLECTSYLTTIIIASASVLVLVITIIGALVYRFRWNLRYLYYMTKFKLFSDYKPMNDVEYEKEVFVSYADGDRNFVLQQIKPELEERGGISLLIHDIHFPPGEYVADNILWAIKSTRRTLIILTKDFLRSKWCMYELNMARMETIDTGRNVLCVILKEDIPLKNLPLEIIDILQKKTYLEYPVTGDNESGFWERLRATLQHRI